MSVVHVHRGRGGAPFSRHALELWLRSPRGRRQVAAEERELRRLLPDVFGRMLLQVGSWGRDRRLISSAETLSASVFGTVAISGTSALGEPERLPFPDRSIDAILLPHTLEFTPLPHNVLREVNRVLNDRGRLFVLGFNPMGLWAWREHFGMRYRGYPPGARYYPVHRVSDWLELLDFEVDTVRHFSPSWSWMRPVNGMDRPSLRALLAPVHETYLLSARKRVIPVNWLGRPQRAQVRPFLAPAPVAVASSHRAQHADEVPAE